MQVGAPAHPGARCAAQWRPHQLGSVPRRPSRVLQPSCPSLVAKCAGKGDNNPLEDVEAYHEAADIYMQATRLSGLQTRYEMETAFQTDAPAASAGPVPSKSAVLALLQEHGLTDREAQGLYRDLYSNGGSSMASGSTMAASKPAPEAPPLPPPRQAPASFQQPPQPPSGRPAQSQAQQQPRKQPPGNPLGIIPMAATPMQVKRPPPGSRPSGPPPQQQPGMSAMGGCGSVPTGFSNATPSRGAPKTPSKRPNTQADNEWDEWSVSSNVSDVTSGAADTWDDSSSIGSAWQQQQQGRPAQRKPAGWGSADQGSSFNVDDYPALGSASIGGCGKVPTTQPGSRPPPSPFQQMCGETVQPIPYNPTADRGGSSFNVDDYPALGSASIGGCGEVPTTQPGSRPPPSPFQQMCGETVQPIPYNPTADPFNNGLPSPSNTRPAQPPPPRAPPSQQPPKAATKPASPFQSPATPPNTAAPAPASPPAAPQPNDMLRIAPDTTPPPITLAQLAAKLDRWSRVLPGLNPARLAAADPKFLEADVAQGLRSLITLVTALPSRDVMSMLDRVPRLLWADDLEGRIKRCKEQLVGLHPSGDPDIVMDMMAEYPELIFRMEYYTQARIVDDLPIEIQNMMIVADQGIGYAYRYYRNRRTNYKAEMTSDEPFEQQT